MSALAELKKIAEGLGLPSGAVTFEKKAPENLSGLYTAL